MNIRRAPDLADLRRVWDWQPCPLGGGTPSLIHAAWHEAGHVVYANWIGLTMRSAEIGDGRGQAIFEMPSAEQLPEPDATDDGHLRATAAGLWHAGLAAELIFTDTPWRGPIARPRSSDHLMAERMLAIGFANTLPGHAFAQLQALHALSAHWDDVTRVAEKLIQAGKWEPRSRRMKFA